MYTWNLPNLNFLLGVGVGLDSGLKLRIGLVVLQVMFVYISTKYGSLLLIENIDGFL